MALAERLLAAEFGEDIVDHHTYVLCSDGDLMEGVSQEAIALAGIYKLNKLIFLYDDNGITIDGPISLTDCVDQVARFKAHGWNASAHRRPRSRKRSPQRSAQAQKSDRPSLIACKTTIGFGAPTKAGTSKAHGEPLGAESSPARKKALGWNYGPFEVPDDILRPWRNAGERAQAAQRDWRSRLRAKPAAHAQRIRAPHGRAQAARRPRRGDPTLKEKLGRRAADLATRKASEMALEVLVAGDAGTAARLGRPDAAPTTPAPRA